MSMLIPWILLALFVATCAMALWAFYHWWKKDRHTRERFAFYGFGALIGFCFFYLSSLTLNTSIITGLATILLKPFGFNIQPSPLPPTEAVMFLLLIGGLIYAYIQVFKHWDGQKSIAQYEQEQNRETASVMADILRLLSRDKEQLAPYQEQAEQQALILETPFSLAWHDQARQLWLLRERSYLFDEEYNPARKYWLGEEKNTGALVLLSCHHDKPEESEIRELAKYAQKIAETRQSSEIEIILALKNGEDSFSKRKDYTLRQITEVSLLKDLVDFSDYFADIRYRVERANLLDSELTIQDTYVPSDYRLEKTGKAQPQSLEVFIQNWLTENSRRQLAVLGEYGQGKSTTSLMLSYHLIEQLKTNSETRIPILLELRGKTLRTLTPEELLATWGQRYNINAQALLHLHMAGRVLLIFEGFDEIDLTGDTEMRVSHFRTLWKLNYEKAKLIITGRPNFFLDDTERKRALGIEDQTKTIYIAPFNLPQIEQSLRSVEAQTRTEIIELAKQDDRFYELVSRPSLLYVVASLWQQEKLSEKREQINSALVMDLFIRQTLQRQQDKHDERPFMALNTAERNYFMAGIAASMMAKDLPNQIDKQQLDEAVRSLVKVIPDVVSQGVTTVRDENSLPLKSQERFDWKNRETEILQQINTDVRSCGLLVSDLSKDGTFKFAHKSFMEFLQAQVMSQLFASDTGELTTGRSIANTWTLRIEQIQNSKETNAFLAELLQVRLQEQGIIEDTVLASSLWDILVLGKLSSEKTFSYLLKILKVSPGIWLANKLLRYFGTNKKEILYSYLAKFSVAAGAVAGAVAGTSLGADTGNAFASIFAFGIMMGLGGAVAETSINLLPIVLVMLFSGLMAMFTSAFLSQRVGEWQRSYFWYLACRNLQLKQQAIEKTVGKEVAALLAEEKID